MEDGLGPTRTTIRRRDVLKLGAAAVSGALVAPARGAAQTPKKGGHLRIGINGGSSTDSLDPRQLVGSFSVNVSRQIYNTLIAIGDDGRPTPELAERWEARDGNRSWIVGLRQGVQFHSGKALDAADVAYSLQLHVGPKTTSKAKSLLASLLEVRVVDPHQVELVLKDPNPDIPYVLSDLHFAIVPAGFEDWANPVGTGPFALKSFSPAIKALTDRNANYWKAGVPHVDSVETLSIPDQTARLNALQSRSIDVAGAVDYKLAPLLARSRDTYLVVTEGKQHFSLPMDARAAPFSDPDVVLALKYAIDREQIVKVLMAGYGRVGNDQPIAASDPDFNPDIPQTTFDPDKSRFHLAKAGRSDLVVGLSAANTAFEQAVNVAQLYQQSAKASGIVLDIKREPDDGYWSQIWMKKPWASSFWAGRPSASMMFTSVYLSTAPWNETRWTNETFDRDLKEALSSPDPQKQRQIYFELQKIIHDDCPTVIPAFASWVDAARKNVQGFVANPNGMLSDHRVAERVWFDG